METTAELPRPVSIDRKTGGKKRRAQSKSTPKPADGQAPATPDPLESAIPAEFREPAGEPDHSLVPTAPKKLMEPADFFRFWHSIPKRERDAWFIAYPYRRLPVLDVLQPLSVEEMRAIERKQKKRPESNCGKLSEPFNPDNWELDVYQWKGAGDYQIRLNDTHPSVRGTVCETQIRGLREWDRFPPVIDNLAEVVLEEPLNQPYLRWARLKGIKFPGDPGAEVVEQPTESEDEMANVAAVEKLADALVEQSRRPHPVAAPAANADATAEAIRAVTGSFKETSKALVDMIQEGNKAKADAENPVVFFDKVMEARDRMAPAAAGSGNEALILRMMDMQTANTTALIAQMEKRLEQSDRRAEEALNRLAGVQAPPAAAAVAPVDPIKGALDLIKGLASLRDVAGPLLQGAAVETIPTTVWERLAEKGMEALPNLVHNFAVLKTGQGTPQAPDLAPELIAEETTPAVTTPELKTEEEEVFSKRRIAEALHAPLIESLNRGDHGFQFAAGMIIEKSIMGFPGEMVYEMAINQGKDGMLTILQAAPELWQKLVKIPKKVDTYLDEFLDSEMAYAIVQEARNPKPPAQVEVLSPEPKPNGSPAKPAGGRTIIDASTGKPVQTA